MTVTKQTIANRYLNMLLANAWEDAKFIELDFMETDEVELDRSMLEEAINDILTKVAETQ